MTTTVALPGIKNTRHFLETVIMQYHAFLGKENYSVCFLTFANVSLLYLYTRILKKRELIKQISS